MLLIYLLFITSCGRFIYKLFNADSIDELKIFPIYFLLGFGGHFSLWLALNALFQIRSPIYSIILISILGGIYFINFIKNYQVESLKIDTFSNLIGPSLAFLLAILQYTVDCFQTISAVIFKNGIIYQDILYHAGISNAILETGFPIKDFFYNGLTIKYHIFSHFIAAQFGFITQINMPTIFTIIFQVFTLLAFSFLAYYLLDMLTKNKLKFFQLLFLFVIVSNLFFLPIKRFSGLNLPRYYSFSYLWQMISFLSLFIILEKFNRKYENLLKLNTKEYLLILIICLIAIISKGSSLPLFLFGFAALYLIEFIKTKNWDPQFIIFYVALALFSMAIYVVFFNSEFSELHHNLTTANMAFLLNMIPNDIDAIIKIICQTFSLAYSKLMPLIAILFTIFSALNFRIFLVKEIIKGAQPATLVMAFYIIGLYFFIFHTNNPWYFIYIIIFISGIYAIAALINSWKEMRLIIKIVSCILIIASIYPISSTGKTFNEYIQKHLSDYFPMSPAKYELYKKLKTISRKTDLILTPSLYSTKNKIADNYYPPAFTSRQFLLSGYRFGFGKNHPDFLARKNLCDNFNTASLTDYNQFKKYGIKFILIEKDIYDQETLSALEANILKTKNYSLIFENDAGIVAQVN